MDLPKQFLECMRKMLGNEYNNFLNSYNKQNFFSLRLNPLKDTSKILNNFTEPVPWAKYGFYYNDNLKPGKSIFHDTGLYYIQEASAMSVAEILAPSENDTVLDLCAAPGGKSTQIATLMNNKGLLISNEIISKRATILADNIARLGITNTIVLNESPENIANKFQDYFDKILVDAPCSGEGMFRKNPEAISEWSEENVKMCQERQLNILNTIKDCLKPNGTLVYSTCTFSPEEDEQVIEQFLLENPEFTLAEIDHTYFSKGLKSNTLSGLSDIEKTVRIFPHVTNGEGHYIAKMIKNGDSFDTITTNPLKSNIDKKSLEILNKFLNDCSINLTQGILLNFNNHLYLAPQNTPNLDKLKIQMAGLYLGEIDKNKIFIPSHNLALALKPVNTLFNTPYNQPTTTKYIELNENQLRNYINGLTIDADTNLTGWTLITYNNNSVGWGKIVNSTIKNHYPKYLRKNELNY